MLRPTPIPQVNRMLIIPPLGSWVIFRTTNNVELKHPALVLYHQHSDCLVWHPDMFYIYKDGVSECRHKDESSNPKPRYWNSGGSYRGHPVEPNFKKFVKEPLAQRHVISVPDYDFLVRVVDKPC